MQLDGLEPVLLQDRAFHRRAIAGAPRKPITTGKATPRHPISGALSLPLGRLLLGAQQYCAVQFRGISGATESLNGLRVSQPPCDACERIERIALRLRRKEKQEDNVDRLAINCVKVDGVLKTNQCAVWFLQIWDPSMGDSYTASRPSGPKILAF
jgi:hypothetical protein